MLGKLKEVWCDNLTVEDLSMILRQIFVKEILKLSIQPHDLELDFTAEAGKFLASGHFSTVLGDLMPLAIATASLVLMLQDANVMYSLLLVAHCAAAKIVATFMEPHHVKQM